MILTANRLIFLKMIIPFKTQLVDGSPSFFMERILAGFYPDMFPEFIPSIHVFRNSEKWVAGNTIHFTSGIATKDQFTFHACSCDGVQPVELGIDERHDFYVELLTGDFSHEQSRRSSTDQLLLFAVNSGFNNFQQMVTDFFPRGRYSHYRPLRGQIVHWTSFRYQ